MSGTYDNRIQTIREMSRPKASAVDLIETYPDQRHKSFAAAKLYVFKRNPPLTHLVRCVATRWQKKRFPKNIERGRLGKQCYC